jgi:hypothetical protein
MTGVSSCAVIPALACTIAEGNRAATYDVFATSHRATPSTGQQR